MDAREKEQYLREYYILKGKGKPFFPYAVFKDSAMAAIVMLVIILVGFVIAYILKAALRSILRLARFDRLAEHAPADFFSGVPPSYRFELCCCTCQAGHLNT